MKEQTRREFSHFWENTWVGFLLVGLAILLYCYRGEFISVINGRFNTNYEGYFTFPLSIFLAFVGFLVIIGGSTKPHKNIETGSQSSKIAATPNHDLLLKEYELSQSMHNYYGKIIWEIASIFIGGGLAAVGLVASRVQRPTIVVSLIALAFTILMIGFYVMNRRWRELVEVHLSRCRQIEMLLGFRQHQLASMANAPSGVLINQGRYSKWIRATFPSGWGTIQLLVIGLVGAVWIIAIYFL